MTARVLNEIFFKNFVYVCSLSTHGDHKGPKFTTLDVLLTVLSIVTFFSDIATDVIVVTHYVLSELWVYAGMTLFFVLMPSFVVNLFSLRWHVHDKRSSRLIWAANVLQFGVLHRYCLSLKTGLKAQRTKDPDDFQDLFQQHSDLCMLRLFDSFLESAPQLVLQLYIMITYENWNPWTGISALLSLLSLGWGIAAYGKAMRLYRADKQHLSWTGLILQTMWRFGTMTSRITAMVLFACVCGPWTLLVLGFHWILMTLWVIFHDTDFCPTLWEERVYNAVVGVIYTFCFFNVKEGRSRRRVVSFYALTGLQNLVFLLVYCLASEHDELHMLVAMAVVVGSFVTGMFCMGLYYRFFHPSGPILLCQSSPGGSLQGGKVVEATQQKSTPTHGNSPKCMLRPSPAAMSTSHSFRTLKHVDYRHQVPPTQAALSSPNESPAGKEHSDKVRFDESPHHRWEPRSPLNCSLKERHRSHSQSCRLELDDDDYDDPFNAMRERAVSRHCDVNYNFRPMVVDGAPASLRRHCSCLVLFPMDRTFVDGATHSRRGLQGVKSAPNMHLQRLTSRASSLGPWSMCNYFSPDSTSVAASDSDVEMETVAFNE